MSWLTVYVDDRTHRVLDRVSAERECSVEEFAEAAIADAAIRAERDETPKGHQ